MNRRDEVVARVRQDLADATRETCEQIDGKYQLVANIKAEVAALCAELAALRTEQTKEDICVRGAGEGKLPAATVHRRRTTEQNKTAAPLIARITAREKQRDSTLVEIAKLETGVTMNLVVAQSRADQYAAFVRGLHMRYWRALLRVHQEQGKLATRRWEWPALAAWTTQTDYRTVLMLGPPPSRSLADSLEGDSVVDKR